MSLDGDTARMYAAGNILRRRAVEDLLKWAADIERRLQALEKRERLTLHIAPVRITDCGCPLMAVCGNVACPRRPKVCEV